MIDYSLVKKSLHEKLSAEEERTLGDWLSESAENREYYARFRRFDPSESEPDMERELAAFMSDIRHADKRRKPNRLVRIAAACSAAAAVLAVGLFLWFGDLERPASQLFSRGVQTHSVSTSRGQTYQVRLPDGSLVWLSAMSRLTWPDAFRGGSRRVTLDGEAYFEVTGSERPFIVSAADAEVRVYGTRFTVNCINPIVRTVLVSGKVGVKHTGGKSGEIMLTPSQMCDLDMNSGRFTVASVDTDSYTGWMNDEFIFDDQTIGQIMDQLGRWYDIRVHYGSDEAKQRRFSGQFSRDGEVERILSLIGQISLVKFRVEGKDIYIE